MERVVLATGGLLAQEQATLSVKVPGRLTVLAVDMGSQVQTGDLIAQIEPRDYELRVNQAAAALAQARAVLGLPLEGDDDRMHLEATSPVRQAQAVLGEVQANRDRVLRLTEQGISSPSERDTVEAAYQVAQSRYEAALDEARTRQAALSQRRAELDLARKQLSDTAVRAPFGGSVQARIANLGEYVATGSPVVRLVRTDPLRLRLDVAETDAHAVRIGQLARFTVVGTSNQIEVRVTRLSPALQERSRMLVAEADVPNNGSLRAGSFVRGQVVVGNDDEGVAIPPAALVVFAGLEKVLLVREGKAIEQPVATGRSGAGWIEIVSGLAAGQEVILNPGNLQTGQAVSLPAASATAPQAADGTDRSEVPPSSGGAR
jgi:RND family efflux transporter MFP subunit